MIAPKVTVTPVVVKELWNRLNPVAVTSDGQNEAEAVAVVEESFELPA